MIVGIGVDIVEIERIRRAFEAYGDRFLRRLFQTEEAESWKRAGSRLESLAGAWAAKEAAAKALGTGLSGFSMPDVVILRDKNGQPHLVLKGSAAIVAARRGVQRLHLSISHDKQSAVAMVVAESGACNSEFGIE